MTATDDMVRTGVRSLKVISKYRETSSEYRFYAELHKFQNMPDPVMPTKEEMERKYKRQARYERGKENF